MLAVSSRLTTLEVCNPSERFIAPTVARTKFIGRVYRQSDALEALLDGHAEVLTQKAIEMALAGDMTALRLCLDRILPARRDRPVTFRLPPLSSASDARAASAALLAAVSEGGLTPNEAAEVGKLIDAYVKAAELTEVLARIENLEQKL